MFATPYQAIEWSAKLDAKQIMEKREHMVRQIELASLSMREGGVCDEWFDDADAITKSVAGDCNGHLFEQLLKKSNYLDTACAELLRRGEFRFPYACLCVVYVFGGVPFACVIYAFVAGAAMVGELPTSGIGRESLDTSRVSGNRMVELVGKCAASNERLLKRLREESNASELLDATRKDAQRGRMSMPTQATAVDLQEFLFRPRFGVIQEKENGQLKLRPVDHFSWSAFGVGTSA